MCRLFESIRIEDGAITGREYHEARMRASRSALFGAADTIDLVAAVAPFIPGEPGVFKCRVVYSEAVESVEVLPYVERRIETLKLVRADSIEYPHKFSDRRRLEELFSLRDGCDDILIVKHGYITDTSFGNVAFRRRDRWITPDTCLLPGTMRARLLDEGLLEAAPVGAEDIGTFSAVTIINAMLAPGRLVVPVGNVRR